MKWRLLLAVILMISLIGCAQRRSEPLQESGQACEESESCQREMSDAKSGAGEKLALGAVTAVVVVVAIPLFLVSYILICPFSDAELCNS